MDVVELFKADVPPEFLTRLHGGIRSAYLSAKKSVDSQNIGEEERYNVMPWTRRGHVESRLRDAAAMSGIEVETEKTGFWRHVVLTCGRFRITQTTSIDSETPLRKAGYKCNYANEQTLLPGFEEIAPTVAACDPHIYAVVLHRASVLAEEPDFMMVRFPKPDLDGFHPGEIDLSLYAALPREKPSTATEAVADQALPKLRPKSRSKSG